MGSNSTSDDEFGIVHDLNKLALENRCYITWVGAGAGMGAFIGSGAAGLGAGPGALIGGLGGLLWAIKSCKPISNAASELMTTSYLTETELQRFQTSLQPYAPVSRDQALALAKIALDAYPGGFSGGGIAVGFSADLQQLLKNA